VCICVLIENGKLTVRYSCITSITAPAYGAYLLTHIRRFKTEVTYTYVIFRRDSVLRCANSYAGECRQHRRHSAFVNRCARRGYKKYFTTTFLRNLSHNPQSLLLQLRGCTNYDENKHCCGLSLDSFLNDLNQVVCSVPPESGNADDDVVGACRR